MAHETNHCDVIDCPECWASDRETEISRAWDQAKARIESSCQSVRLSTDEGPTLTNLDAPDDAQGHVRVGLEFAIADVSSGELEHFLPALLRQLSQQLERDTAFRAGRRAGHREGMADGLARAAELAAEPVA